jgi:hypothetical protein
MSEAQWKLETFDHRIECWDEHYTQPSLIKESELGSLEFLKQKGQSLVKNVDYIVKWRVVRFHIMETSK